MPEPKYSSAALLAIHTAEAAALKRAYLSAANYADLVSLDDLEAGIAEVRALTKPGAKRASS